MKTIRSILASIDIRPINISRDFEYLGDLVLSPKSGMAAVLKGNNGPLSEMPGAWDGNKMIGWAVIGGRSDKRRGKTKYGYNPQPMVFVAPEYRGRDVGRRLVQTAMDSFRIKYEDKEWPGDTPNVVYYDTRSGQTKLFEPIIKAAGFTPVGLSY